MGNHEAVDVALTAFRPLSVVLPHDRRAVSENVGHLLERRALFQEAGSESVAISESYVMWTLPLG